MDCAEYCLWNCLLKQTCINAEMQEWDKRHDSSQYCTQLTCYVKKAFYTGQHRKVSKIICQVVDIYVQ